MIGLLVLDKIRSHPHMCKRLYKESVPNLTDRFRSGLAGRKSAVRQPLSGNSSQPFAEHSPRFGLQIAPLAPQNLLSKANHETGPWEWWAR